MTAVVKLFLKRPDKAQGLVQKVLQAATAETDNPDIRDRAYVYWRLLSNTTDPNAAKNVVLSEKPPIKTTIQSLPPALLDQLIGELSTLASVYHKPPEQFVGQGRFGADAVQKAAIEYVSSVFKKDIALLTTLLGNNFKTPARTRLLRLRLRLPSQAKHRRHKHRTTLRTFSTSTSTVLPLHLPSRSRQAVCPAWRAWPEHP